jgi:hypothetical protein
VANETRRYSSGVAIAFDDSYMHSVRNDGDADRVVLLVDVWNPELRGDAIAKIRSLCLSKAFTQGCDSHFDLTSRPRSPGASYDYMLKTLCIGDPGVGKSRLVLRMADLDMKEPWIDRYVASLGIDYSVAIHPVRNLTVKFQCWDVGGRERFRKVPFSQYKIGQIIFLLIDTTDSSPVSDILGIPTAFRVMSILVCISHFILRN